MAKKRRKIRVIIADDHSLFAAAVQAILGGDDRFEVIGLASDGSDAVKQATRKKPDVVLMDIAMPVLDGFEATKELHKHLPGLPVVMLTGSNARLDIDTARKVGAAGFVTKDRIARELIDAIVDVTGS